MRQKNKIQFAEVILIIIVWILIIFIPLIFNEKKIPDLEFITTSLKVIIPLFITFIINRFILVPKILFIKKTFIYIFSVMGLITIFTLGSYLYSKNYDKKPPAPSKTFQQWRPPPQLHRPLPQHRRPIPTYANYLLFSILLIGFDSGLRASFKLAATEKAKEKLEKENIENQLAFLKNQISPHFFMNTLNNIHSQIDINTEEAKHSIIQLSKLMRHLLYESEIEKIGIKEEIEFIKNYVNLMKLRFSDKVKISLDIPDQIPNKAIPPLLFTSFLENAFKHGISYQHKSFIDISFKFNSNKLTFDINNSNPKNQNKESTGIGNNNSIKRLELIYGKNYALTIEDNLKNYFVHLSIPI